MGWVRVAPLSDIWVALATEGLLALQRRHGLSVPSLYWYLVLTPSLDIHGWASLSSLGLFGFISPVLSWGHDLLFATLLELIPSLSTDRLAMCQACDQNSLNCSHDNPSTHPERHVTGYHFSWVSQFLLGASSTAWLPLCPHYLIVGPRLPLTSCSKQTGLLVLKSLTFAWILLLSSGTNYLLNYPLNSIYKKSNLESSF